MTKHQALHGKSFAGEHRAAQALPEAFAALDVGPLARFLLTFTGVGSSGNFDMSHPACNGAGVDYIAAALLQQDGSGARASLLTAAQPWEPHKRSH